MERRLIQMITGFQPRARFPIIRRRSAASGLLRQIQHRSSPEKDTGKPRLHRCLAPRRKRLHMTGGKAQGNVTHGANHRYSSLFGQRRQRRHLEGDTWEQVADLPLERRGSRPPDRRLAGANNQHCRNLCRIASSRLHAGGPNSASSTPRHKRSRPPSISKQKSSRAGISQPSEKIILAWSSQIALQRRINSTVAMQRYGP